MHLEGVVEAGLEGEVGGDSVKGLVDCHFGVHRAVVGIVAGRDLPWAYREDNEA